MRTFPTCGHFIQGVVLHIFFTISKYSTRMHRTILLAGLLLPLAIFAKDSVQVTPMVPKDVPCGEGKVEVGRVPAIACVTNKTIFRAKADDNNYYDVLDGSMPLNCEVLVNCYREFEPKVEAGRASPKEYCKKEFDSSPAAWPPFCEINPFMRHYFRHPVRVAVDDKVMFELYVSLLEFIGKKPPARDPKANYADLVKELIRDDDYQNAMKEKNVRPAPAVESFLQNYCYLKLPQAEKDKIKAKCEKALAVYYPNFDQSIACCKREEPKLRGEEPEIINLDSVAPIIAPVTGAVLEVPAMETAITPTRITPPVPPSAAPLDSRFRNPIPDTSK